MIGGLTVEEIDFMGRRTNHYGGNCCCESCDPSFCYTCGHYLAYCMCMVAEILSPNYCDGTRHRRDDDVPF